MRASLRLSFFCVGKWFLTEKKRPRLLPPGPLFVVSGDVMVACLWSVRR